MKFLLVAPGRTWEYLDNVQHQLSSAGSFMIKAKIIGCLQAAVGLVTLCGHSFKTLLSFERNSIRSTVNDCSVLEVKLRLLNEGPGFVLKSKSRKVGSLGLPVFRFAGNLIRVGLRT